MSSTLLTPCCHSWVLGMRRLGALFGAPSLMSAQEIGPPCLIAPWHTRPLRFLKRSVAEIYAELGGFWRFSLFSSKFVRDSRLCGRITRCDLSLGAASRNNGDMSSPACGAPSTPPPASLGEAPPSPNSRSVRAGRLRRPQTAALGGCGCQDYVARLGSLFFLRLLYSISRPLPHVPPLCSAFVHATYILQFNFLCVHLLLAILRVQIPPAHYACKAMASLATPDCMFEFFWDECPAVSLKFCWVAFVSVYNEPPAGACSVCGRPTMLPMWECFSRLRELWATLLHRCLEHISISLPSVVSRCTLPQYWILRRQSHVPEIVLDCGCNSRKQHLSRTMASSLPIKNPIPAPSCFCTGLILAAWWFLPGFLDTSDRPPNSSLCYFTTCLRPSQIPCTTTHPVAPAPCLQVLHCNSHIVLVVRAAMIL